ncbi:MAG: zinc-binding dehydrogenase, partial [Planctomycetota bacterium]
FHLGFHTLADPKRRRDSLTWLTRAMKENALLPVIDRVFTFSELADAYHHLEASNQFGKIVVDFNDKRTS